MRNDGCNGDGKATIHHIVLHHCVKLAITCTGENEVVHDYPTQKRSGLT